MTDTALIKPTPTFAGGPANRAASRWVRSPMGCAIAMPTGYNRFELQRLQAVRDGLIAPPLAVDVNLTGRGPD